MEAEWNQTYPDKQFPTWRHFRQYLARGAVAALPRYKFPEPKPSPKQQAGIDAFIENLKTSLARSEGWLIEVTDTPKRAG
jgi:hypothetical protein